MLGITAYQDALRALGDALDPSGADPVASLPEQLLLVEDLEQAAVFVTLGEQTHIIGVQQLQELVLASRAQRGSERTTPGPLPDLLRSAGLALDELRAAAVRIELGSDLLAVRYRDREAGLHECRDGHEHELVYAGQELTELRRVAARRRKGQPLRRVLILHEEAASPVSLRELLVAEFAVETLPSLYARAVAQAGDPPHAILLHLSQTGRPEEILAPIGLLRASGVRTADVPILVIGGPRSIDPAAVFAVGADDYVPEPFAPAQLRARLRTWLLRGAAAPAGGS